MDSSAVKPAGPADLLERAGELEIVGGWLEEVTQSASGRVGLIAGEAGVGKTALLRRACADAGPGVRVVSGACDSLFTPQPLGALLDVAEQTGGELADVVAGSAKPHAIATSLLHELG